MSRRQGTVGRRRRQPSGFRRLAGAGALVAIPAIIAAWLLTGFFDDGPPPLEDVPESTLAMLPNRTIIGESVEGRPIVAYAVGSGPDVVVIVGGLHAGPEVETVYLVRQLLLEFRRRPAEIPPGVTLVFIPLANPDGYAMDIRVNANGVDLNRNWGTRDWAPVAMHSGFEVDAGSAPFSEPETRALYQYITGLDPVLVLSYHGYLERGAIDQNRTGRAARLLDAYGRASGYVLLDEWTEYEITGQLIEAMREAGIAAADIELEEGDRDHYRRNLRGLRALLAALATG